MRFRYHGVALPCGGEDADDFNAFTGSVVVHDGTPYLFYTGHNPRIELADGSPQQVVMIATSSDDMKTWTKHPELTFGAFDGHDPADWRDPFVFRAADDEPWQMILAARHDHGPLRRGVVA